MRWDERSIMGNSDKWWVIIDEWWALIDVIGHGLLMVVDEWLMLGNAWWVMVMSDHLWVVID